MTHASEALEAPDRRERRGGLTVLFVLIPLVAFAGLAVLCYKRLGVNVGAIPSPLIGKPPVPFALPVVDPKVPGPEPASARFTDADLKTGGVTIVNFFGSYCEGCKNEHPLLMQLSQDKTLAAMGVRVAGIAWKDKVAETKRYLDLDGNPFAVVGADVSGRTGLDWGLTGVPETYIVKRDGTIAFKYVGEMTERTLADIVMPQIEKAAR